MQAPYKGGTKTQWHVFTCIQSSSVILVMLAELVDVRWRLKGMPRYFFHFNGSRAHRDDIGELLDHDMAAWQQSLRMLRDLEHGFGPGDDWRLEVRQFS